MNSNACIDLHTLVLPCLGLLLGTGALFFLSAAQYLIHRRWIDNRYIAYPTHWQATMSLCVVSAMLVTEGDLIRELMRVG